MKNNIIITIIVAVFGVLGALLFAISPASDRWNTGDFVGDEEGLLSFWNFDTGADDFLKINNGTVSGATLNLTGGYSKGAYEYDGSNDYIRISDSSTYDDFHDGQTISVWIKPIESWTTGTQQIISKNRFVAWSFMLNWGDLLYAVRLNGTTYTAEEPLSALTYLNKWTHVAAVYNLTHMAMFVNGEVLGTPEAHTGIVGQDANDIYLGRFGGSNADFFNGTIDELSIWNRPLSPREIYDIYENGRTNLTVDYSSEIGVINDYFYGTNTHGRWGRNGSQIDTDGDGEDDTMSDVAWHQQKFREAGITAQRGDIGFQYRYTALSNTHAEFWDETEGGGSQEDIPLYWDTEENGATGAVVSRTTNSHSGDYAVSMVSTGGSNGWFSKSKDIALESGHTYNLSAWIKSNDSIRVLLQRKDNWDAPMIGISSGSGDWEYISSQAVISADVSEGWRIVIEGDPNENFIWDDVSLTMDGEKWHLWSDELENFTGLNKWIYDNDYKMLWIASYMPVSMMNYSSECEDSTMTCPPWDYNEFGEMVVEYINITTNDGEYLSAMDYEVWNEPDLPQFWMINQMNDPIRVTRYNKMYNATYDAIKAAYPDAQVGGAATTESDDDSNVFLNAFLGNFSDKMDFISHHEYCRTASNDFPCDTHFETNVYDFIYDKCETYGANCTRFLLSEYNVGTADIQVNQTDVYALQFALMYESALNNYPENLSMMAYQWAMFTNYSDGGHYDEYPYRWTAVAEPGLEDTVYVPFTVSSNFSTYSPVGGIVVTSTSTGSVDIVAVKSGIAKYITVMNKAPYSRNVTIYESTLNNITNAINGTTLTFSGGSVDIGELDSNEIVYFYNDPQLTNTTFKSWNGIAYVDDEGFAFRCYRNQKNCEMYNQDVGSSIAGFEICNQGNANGTALTAHMDVTLTNITTSCDDDFTPAGATLLTTSNQTIHGAVNVGECAYISCWQNFTNVKAAPPSYDIIMYVI